MIKKNFSQIPVIEMYQAHEKNKASHSFLRNII